MTPEPALETPPEPMLQEKPVEKPATTEQISSEPTTPDSKQADAGPSPDRDKVLPDQQGQEAVTEGKTAGCGCSSTTDAPWSGLFLGLFVLLWLGRWGSRRYS